MGQTVGELIERVCGVIRERLNPARVVRARRRHADVLAGRETDYLPMTFSRALEDRKDWPEFDWAEQFHDPAKSVYMQLRDSVAANVRTNADNILNVRADTGVVNGMSIFGARFTVPEHTKPVVTGFPSKAELAAFDVPDDISALGTMPRVREHMEHHLAVLAQHGLDGVVSVCHCDQQGPFDIAAQTRGHDIFVDLYEDPDFVHALMEKCTGVYVAVTRLCKTINGEAAGPGNAVGYWMERGAVRMCGDSDILINAEQHREFVRPYIERAFAELGDGWFHYCGGVAGFKRPEGLHLHDSLATIPGLRGLNWTTAGDYLPEMRKLKARGVAHLAGLTREPNEPLEDYFRRFLSVYDRRCGAIFTPDLRPGEHDRAMDAWHAEQDRHFGS